jgi:hypothetical protein
MKPVVTVRKISQFIRDTPQIAPKEISGVLRFANPVEPVDKHLVDNGSPEPCCRIHARKLQNPARIPLIYLGLVF